MPEDSGKKEELKKGGYIVKSAIVVFVMTLSYRVLGFLRELLLAYSLGASAEADAYYLAFTTPNLIINMIAFGAISAAAIPIFVKYFDKGDLVSVNALFSKAGSAMAVFLTFLVMGCMFFAPFLVKILAPGFSNEINLLAAGLLQKMLPSLLFIGLLGLSVAVLHSCNDFFTAAFSNVIFNTVLVLFGIIFIYTGYIDLLAYAVVVAAVAQAALVFIRLKAKGVSLSFALRTENTDFNLLLRLMIPICLGSIMSQINLAVGRGFASSLPQGSLAALNYADKLMQLPMGVLVGAVTVTVYPLLSSYAGSDDRDGLLGILQQSIKTLFLVIMPVIVVFNILGEPMVNILFEHGRFSHESTVITASALGWYSFGILGAAMTDIFSKIFYAHHDTATPLKVAAVSMAGNLLLLFFLAPYLLQDGVAMSFSLSSILNAFLLMLIAKKQYVPALVITIKDMLRPGFLTLLFVVLTYITGRIFSVYFTEDAFFVRCGALFTLSVLLSGAYMVFLDVSGLVKIKKLWSTVRSKTK